MEKTITISEINWKKLTILKLKERFKTLDDTINYLFQNVKQKKR